MDVTHLTFSLKMLVIFSGRNQRPLIEFDVFLSSLEVVYLLDFDSCPPCHQQRSGVIIILSIHSLMLLIS